MKSKYEEKILIYCVSIFWLVNVSPVYHKAYFLRILELRQLLQGRLYTERLLICSENVCYLVYHIKFHHSQDEVFTKDLYIVSKAFHGKLTESRLVRAIILLHFLIFWSEWTLKLSFESNTIRKCFWWGHLEISLLLNLIGGCDKLFELIFREKITSLACLLESGLNWNCHW